MMVKSDNPTIALIKNKTSLTSTSALISLAICEVCDFFNVGKNMNDVQIAMTADLIIEQYWHLKLEEIKYCFRRAMREEKLFDRLDGNIILGWLKKYDEERTEEAIRISEQEEREQQNAIVAISPDAMTFREYIDILEDKAADGDMEAIAKLEEIKLPHAQGLSLKSAEENRQKKIAFKQWFYQNYQKGKR